MAVDFMEHRFADDYFAYLFSLTEMIPVDYGARNGCGIDETTYLGFEYMRAIYSSIRK